MRNILIDFESGVLGVFSGNKKIKILTPLDHLQEKNNGSAAFDF